MLEVFASLGEGATPGLRNQTPNASEDREVWNAVQVELLRTDILHLNKRLAAMENGSKV